MSFSIYLTSSASSKSGVIDYFFDPPMSLDKPYEVALTGGKLTNSVPNVSPALNNNTFRYSVDGGVNYETVTLPTGTYQTTALNSELHAAMLANDDDIVVNGEPTYPIRFTANIYLLRFQVELGANCRLDLTAGELYKLLGFTTASILDGGAGGATFTADSIALFTTPGEAFYVQLDIINGGMITGTSSLSGVLKAVEGTGLGVVVSLRDASGDYNYYPVNTNVLRNLKITVFDNLLRVADFNGESVNIELKFRPRFSF